MPVCDERKHILRATANLEGEISDAIVADKQHVRFVELPSADTHGDSVF
jgi:hypothetical protein